MGILSTLAVSSDMWRTSSSSSADLEDLLGGMMSSGSASAIEGAAIWSIVSLILALVGGFVIYFLFVKKKDNPVNKFLAWMKSFLRFDKILLEDIAKISYIIFALFITLSSFGMIGVSFIGFLAYLVLGNLGLRVGYELTMIMIMIWSNTTKIKEGICACDKKAGVEKATKKAEKAEK